MAQSDYKYKRPELPFEPKSNNDNNNYLPINDKNQYSDEYLLDRKNWTFLNHGAFGATLKVGYDRAEQWRCVLLGF